MFFFETNQNWSYEYIFFLFRSMPTDNPAPADWQGGLNTTYYLGGKSAQGRWSVRLKVTQILNFN